jgi:membrane protease YdiL (CAAX protease family)
MTSKYRPSVFISIFLVTIIFVSDHVLTLNYVGTTLLKVTTFLVIPFLWQKLNWHPLYLVPKQHRLREIYIGIILGLGSFAILIASYFVLGQFIDFNSILTELSTKSSINASNFLWVGLYITLGNSFVEEFFFRGFIFLTLYEEGKVKFAYLFSSCLFALYHISIFKSWFNPLFMGIALIGLTFIGFVFNYVNRESKSIINSWLIHIFADSAIILIGLWLFRIL